MIQQAFGAESKYFQKDFLVGVRFTAKQQSQVSMAVTGSQRLSLSATFMSPWVLANNNMPSSLRKRSYHRFPKAFRCWDLFWSEYTDLKFKETFGISKVTFISILEAIGPEMER